MLNAEPYLKSPVARQSVQYWFPKPSKTKSTSDNSIAIKKLTKLREERNKNPHNTHENEISDLKEQISMKDNTLYHQMRTILELSTTDSEKYNYTIETQYQKTLHAQQIDGKYNGCSILQVFLKILVTLIENTKEKGEKYLKKNLLPSLEECLKTLSTAIKDIEQICQTNKYSSKKIPAQNILDDIKSYNKARVELHEAIKLFHKIIKHHEQLKNKSEFFKLMKEFPLETLQKQIYLNYSQIKPYIEKAQEVGKNPVALNKIQKTLDTHTKMEKNS